MESQSTEINEGGCYVALTHEHLQAQEAIDRVRSPQAGAIVLFAGKPTKLLSGVRRLHYAKQLSS